MKFMKLGTRPDTFISLDGSTRTVASEIPTDVTIEVDTTRFLLHKFPLLSKCSYLKKLQGYSEPNLMLGSFPGGAKAFELCAKFCYGVTITVSASNVVAAMSAAAHLQMTDDDQEQGNLLGKLESFFTGCLLRRWKDTLATLRSTPTSSDSLGIAARCAAALAGMISSGDPSREQQSMANISWWAEDLADLDIQQFSTIMGAVKSSGKVKGRSVAEALELYLRRRQTPEKEVVEKVADLLPEEKGSVRCGFLMKLLKAASFVGLEEEGEVRRELVRRAATELEGVATAKEMAGDVRTVVEVVREFMRKNGEEKEKVVKVGRLVDWWLRERKGDMSVEKMVEVAGMVPQWARRDHDLLYRAVDLYLEQHPELNKSERKQLCRIVDCKKLPTETCIHAAQNERLPLRVVVQALFFAGASANHMMHDLPPSIKALLNATAHSSPKPPVLKLIPFEEAEEEEEEEVEEEEEEEERRRSIHEEWSRTDQVATTLRMKLAEEEEEEEEEEVGMEDEEVPRKDRLLRSSSIKFKAFCAMQEKPKRMLTRIWSMNRNSNIMSTELRP